MFSARPVPLWSWFSGLGSCSSCSGVLSKPLVPHVPPLPGLRRRCRHRGGLGGLQQPEPRGEGQRVPPLISDGRTGLPQRPSPCCSTAGPGPGPSGSPPPCHVCGTRWGELVGAGVPTVDRNPCQLQWDTTETKPGRANRSRRMSWTRCSPNGAPSAAGRADVFIFITFNPGIFSSCPPARLVAEAAGLGTGATFQMISYSETPGLCSCPI